MNNWQLVALALGPCPRYLACYIANDDSIVLKFTKGFFTQDFFRRSPRSIGMSVSNGFDGWRAWCDIVRDDSSSSSGTFLSEILGAEFFESFVVACDGRMMSSLGGRLSHGAGVPERVSPFCVKRLRKVPTHATMMAIQSFRIKLFSIVVCNLPVFTSMWERNRRRVIWNILSLAILRAAIMTRTMATSIVTSSKEKME